MLSIIKKLFGKKESPIPGMLSRGAVIVDVRTKDEFKGGHVAGSINIPLDQVQARIQEFKKFNEIIVCCRSGNRSGSAKSILESKGFKNVVNGGSWQNVNTYKIK